MFNRFSARSNGIRKEFYDDGAAITWLIENGFRYSVRREAWWGRMSGAGCRAYVSHFARPPYLQPLPPAPVAYFTALTFGA